MEKGKRCYKQFCGVAKALDVVGDRWTLLIVRDLLLGPWRFKDLLDRLHGMTTNLLASRLKEMEADGLIQKTQQSSLGSSHTYELTELGRQLEAVILSLGKFGFNFMQSGPNPEEVTDIGRALLTLKNRYTGKKSGVVTLTFVNSGEVSFETHYQVSFSEDYVDISNQLLHPSQVQLRLDFDSYRQIAFAGRSARELVKSGKIEIIGKSGIWRDFLSSFGFKP